MINKATNFSEKSCKIYLVKLVITGGHHSSALPVIKRIRDTNPSTGIFWIGHRRSMKGDVNDTLEYREITSLGIPFFDLKAGKVYKTFDPIRILKVPFGFFQALFLLIKIRPDVILSFGGYLAVPVVIAGWFLGIPSVTHEQTVVAGYANKVISLFAKKILVSWPQSMKNFPKKKTIFSGIPLRKDLDEVRSENYSINKELPTVFIVAGKTGSHTLNTLVFNNLEKLLKFCNLIHQCGDNSVFSDFEKLSQRYQDLSKDNTLEGKYFPKKFIYSNEIGEVYAKADLVVSRAGAHTVSELLYLKKPCLLIPIPWVSHNEQYENAKMLVESGLGKILNEKDCSEETFIQEIIKMLGSLHDYSIKDAKFRNIIRNDAEDIIVNEVIKTSGKS